MIFKVTVWALWVRFYSYAVIFKTGITDVCNLNWVTLSSRSYVTTIKMSDGVLFDWLVARVSPLVWLRWSYRAGSLGTSVGKQDMDFDLMTCRCGLTCPCVNSGRSQVQLEVYGCTFLQTQANKVQSPVLHSWWIWKSTRVSPFWLLWTEHCCLCVFRAARASGEPEETEESQESRFVAHCSLDLLQSQSDPG